MPFADGGNGRCNSNRSPLFCNCPAHGPKIGTLAGTPYFARNSAGSPPTSSAKEPACIVTLLGKVKDRPSSRQRFVGAAESNNTTFVVAMFWSSTNSSPPGGG